MAGSSVSLSQFHTRLSPPSALWTADRPLSIRTKVFETSPSASPTSTKSPTAALLRSPLAFDVNASCSSPRSSFGTNSCASPRTGHVGNGAPQFQSSTATGSVSDPSFLYVKPQTQIEKPVTLYDVLGISDLVTDDEIKAAFRSMAKKFHPDQAPPEKVNDFQQKFMEVHRAYSILKDPRTRALYNYEIKNTLLSRQWRHDERKGQWRGRNWETDQCWTL
ncbi:hypothetical protein MPTK1_4g17730 [Marchantia polymorpha subsp. ruderalis]|uniref:J domain-containing protein n=2 Tax=Marchantia polymorpha TaxID=3197 RepID=A0AAF6BAY3_MARPO|nr:hypothetical protein MARPO_0041s0054 [Marchantia polymorpha]PTQ40156.1 hypothetical protein MARPO_0041s0054 [Marchantia polymorpha]BBN09167.1 hypothetical protein Mp_4g17730 [Marchantia polymorpha subsp. ruderalis]BBN09168.1 hypothetical protein Mp_4g17730 [Marchantia polymorpha subsp. ruderalis]|eukprot:PTQ40155.1 hypothetical protein MARPO_0041s0054 [Marchantia polymorpha]